jgi:hypothetical protein
MSYYAPRTYSTTKRMEVVTEHEPAARYSDVSKKEYLPNEQDFDPDSTPEKTKIFIALLITLAMT